MPHGEAVNRGQMAQGSRRNENGPPNTGKGFKGKGCEGNGVKGQEAYLKGLIQKEKGLSHQQHGPLKTQQTA